MWFCVRVFEASRVHMLFLRSCSIGCCIAVRDVFVYVDTPC